MRGEGRGGRQLLEFNLLRFHYGVEFQLRIYYVRKLNPNTDSSISLKIPLRQAKIYPLLPNSLAIFKSAPLISLDNINKKVKGNCSLNKSAYLRILIES